MPSLSAGGLRQSRLDIPRPGLPAIGLIVLLGIFRTVVPLEGGEYAGILIILCATPFLLYEALLWEPPNGSDITGPAGML